MRHKTCKPLYMSITTMARTLFTLCLMSVVVIGVMSCATSRDFSSLYPVKPGEMFEISKACCFIDNPGVGCLVPVDSRFLSGHVENSAGIIPAGTKVKFLGAFSESGFMLDSRIRTYGRILEGQFRRRKVCLDYVIEQSEEAKKALSRIERTSFGLNE